MNAWALYIKYFPNLFQLTSALAWDNDDDATGKSSGFRIERGLVQEKSLPSSGKFGNQHEERLYWRWSENFSYHTN